MIDAGGAAGIILTFYLPLLIFYAIARDKYLPPVCIIFPNHLNPTD